MADKVTDMTEFDGERESWTAWKTRRNGWKIRNKKHFKGYFGVTQPSKRERVTTAYTVADDEANDPTGAEPGARVAVESEATFARKERQPSLVPR